MAKDKTDLATVDALPKKIGRPTIKEDGPLSGAERARRSRLGKKSVVITTEARFHLDEYCKRSGRNHCDVASELLLALKLPRAKKSK